MRENSRTNIPRENRHWVPIERLLRRSNSAKNKNKQKMTGIMKKSPIFCHMMPGRELVLIRIGTNGDNKKTIQ